MAFIIKTVNVQVCLFHIGAVWQSKYDIGFAHAVLFGQNEQGVAHHRIIIIQIL